MLYTTVALVALAPGAFADLSGTYTGKSDDGTVTVTVKQAADGTVTGTMTDGGTTFTFTGKVSDDGKRASGNISYQGIEIPFELRPKSGAGYEFVLKLAGEEEVTALTRSGGAPAPEKPSPKKPAAAPAPAKATPPAALPEGSNVLRHPAGLDIPVPAGWKIAHYNGLSALLPPGATKVDGDELYLLLVGEAGGITSRTDPRLAQFVEALLNGTSEQDRGILNGAATFRQTGRENGLTYEGTANNGSGVTIYARCVLAEPKGRIAAVLALGLKNKIQPREAALLKAMAAVRGFAPEYDSRLVGVWSGTTQTRSLDARDAVGRQQASSVSDTQIRYQITADGQFVEAKTSRTIAIGQGVSIDSGDQTEKTTGRWAASGGKIALGGANGLYAIGSYRIVGGQVILEIGNQIITLSR